MLFAMFPRLAAWFVLAVILLPPTGPAIGKTKATDPRVRQLTELNEAGKKQEALELAESFLVATPNDPAILITVARLHQGADQIDQALVLGQRLVTLLPASYVVWELMVQLYQAAGDLPKRDDALKQLLTAQRNALDPEVRLRPYIIRDRIEVPGRSIAVRETFDTSSPDQVKYVFVLLSEAMKPENYLVVRADNALTQAWRDAGILAPGKRVFTLASVYRKGRGSARAIYEVYPKPPDYDVVRAKVMEILAGTAKPLSGSPGGLAIPAR